MILQPLLILSPFFSWAVVVAPAVGCCKPDDPRLGGARVGVRGAVTVPWYDVGWKIPGLCEAEVVA